MESGVFPVRKDDVVSTFAAVIVNAGDTSANLFGCWFIPPIYSTPPAPIVVDEGAGGSYAYSEVKTAETWHDSKPIYKRTITFTTTATAQGAWMTIGNKSLLSNDIERLVRTEMSELRGGSGGLSHTSSSNVRVNYLGSNDIEWLALGDAWGGGYTLDLTAYYTKTTD
jgi:hypothetical protein